MSTRSSYLFPALLILGVTTSAGCSSDIGDLIDDDPPSAPADDKPTPEHVPVPETVRCYDNFDKFKRAKGAAGKGRHWHHIVEKHRYNRKKFTDRRLNCEDNLIAIEEGIHYKISGHYSRLRPGKTRQTVRRWIRSQSWARQRDYGLNILRQHGIEP